MRPSPESSYPWVWPGETEYPPRWSMSCSPAGPLRTRGGDRAGTATVPAARRSQGFGVCDSSAVRSRARTGSEAVRVSRSFAGNSPMAWANAAELVRS